MHLGEMRIKYPNHVTLKTTVEKCNECGLAIQTMLELGTNVKNKFLVDYIMAVVGQGGNLIPLLWHWKKMLKVNKR